MRGLFRWFRRRYVAISNTIIFVALAIWYGVPFHSWPKLWADFEVAHKAWIRRIVWQLIMDGKVYKDEDGRLWPKEDKS